METEQTPPTQAETPKLTLQDVTDDELKIISGECLQSYEIMAELIYIYYGIKTSRQAVYKRMSRIHVEKDQKTAQLKRAAKDVLQELLNQDKDMRIKLQAVKVLLNDRNW